MHYISGIEITVGGQENPTRNEKSDQKIQSFYRKNRLVFIFTTSFFFLQIKKVKKLQHFSKFCDLSCTVCMNRKMCF